MSDKKKRGSFGGSLLHNLFGFGKEKRQLSPLEEEAMQSPFRTIVKNFRENKIAMTGTIILVVIFLICFIYPAFKPLDLNFQDPSQQNCPPGFQIINVPDALKNNAKQIDAGAVFGVGLDNKGNVYEWGNLSEKLKKLPKKMGKVEQIAAGADHALAVNEKGEVFTWGYDRQGLKQIPIEVDQLKGVKQIVAGNQFSIVIGENGKGYIWGAVNAVDLKFKKAVQGKLEKVVVNSSTGVALLDDGSVVCLANLDHALANVPAEIGTNAVDIAVTDKTAAAVLKDGSVVTWGSGDNGINTVPEMVQGKAAAISGGRNHFTALTSSGTVYSWGGNDYKQAEAPKALTGVEKISSNYYSNYAIDGNGKVTAWGLKGYLMGTDGFGRPVASRMITGGRMTMTVGAVSVIISTIIGILVGGISGYYGGKADNILMRFTEIVSSLPFLPMAMTLSGVLGTRVSELGRIIMIMCILGFLSWPGLARLVRGQILAEREKEFVTAARAVGIQEKNIIFKHIIPNVITVIIVSVTLSFATCMLTESGLSFLGFGVNEPQATWGNMLNSCRASEIIGNYWWRWIFPSIALGLCTISINLIGDGLRDAIDPKSNER